jgi:hypothetical protein
MNILYSSFWGEGRTDERFFPILIKRVLDELLQACARGEWDVEAPITLKSEKDGFVASVLDVAQQSIGYSLVFVHTDADAPSIANKALPNKIDPALKAVEALDGNQACKYVVPVVPVTKSENWKLADLEALEQILGVQLDRQALGLNKSAENLEEYADSKSLLQNVIKAAGAQRRRKNALSNHVLDDALAKQISLQALNKFTSFRHFLDGLKKVLIDQNIIEQDCSPSFITP